MHSQDIGPVLLQAGTELSGEVLVREVEHLYISHGVARAVFVFADLEEQQVPVVIQQAFFLQPLEVFLAQLDIPGFFLGLVDVIVEPGLLSLRSAAIGPSLELVLLDSKRQADL